MLEIRDDKERAFETIISHYEQLRRQVLEGEVRQPGTWALLVRRGMAQWMQAWTAAESIPPPRAPDSRGTALDLARAGDVAQMLANMVFHHLGEVRHG